MFMKTFDKTEFHSRTYSSTHKVSRSTASMQFSFLLVAIGVTFIANDEVVSASRPTSVSNEATADGVSYDKKSLRGLTIYDEDEEKARFSAAFDKIFGSTKATKRAAKETQAAKNEQLLKTINNDGNKRIPVFDEWARQGRTLDVFDQKFGDTALALSIRHDYKVHLQDLGRKDLW